MPTPCPDSSLNYKRDAEFMKVTSVIDRWLAAVVNTDARLLATVRLSSLVSCNTRWYLKKRRPQVFCSNTKNSLFYTDRNRDLEDVKDHTSTKMNEYVNK